MVRWNTNLSNILINFITSRILRAMEINGYGNYQARVRAQ